MIKDGVPSSVILNLNARMRRNNANKLFQTNQNANSLVKDSKDVDGDKLQEKSKGPAVKDTQASMMGSIIQYDQAFTSKMVEKFNAEEREIDLLMKQIDSKIYQATSVKDSGLQAKIEVAKMVGANIDDIKHKKE